MSAPQPIAVRGWAEPVGGWTRRRKPAGPGRRQARRHGVTEVLSFDVETRTTFNQRFLFGAWRVYVDGLGIEEGIVVADDLSPAERATVEDYARAHRADVAPGHPDRLVVMELREWVNVVFFRYAVRRQAVVVGFNLPFDLGAMARHAGEARTNRRADGARPDLYAGGWSLALWGRPDGRGGWDENGRPRLRIRRLNRHGAFIGFGPSGDDRAHHRRAERGRFVDLSTLAYALSGRTHTLAGACEAFGVPCDKVATDFGTLSETLIEHCRADVAPLVPLYGAMAEVCSGLPGIGGDLGRLYSPATVAARLLDAMGLRPPLDAHGDAVGPEVLGIAGSSSYGGHAEATIVRTDVPVVVLDWSAQYPTVAHLVGAWAHFRAESVDVVDVTEELVEWLAAGDVATACTEAETWRRFGLTFALVVPDGDPLPHRVHLEGRWALRFGPLSAEKGLWFSWADVAAATVRTGRPPKVIRAIRLVPSGTQPDLRSVRLGGTSVDPRRADLFAELVTRRRAATEAGDGRQAQLLKVMVNALAHGLPGQLNERPKGGPVELQCWAGDAEPFRSTVHRVEEPGRWHWPPISATVTAGGRLLLALAQRLVEEAGGTWAYSSTDSLGIVATPGGGLVAVEGGPERSADGTEAVRALSWKAVENIRQRFRSLNPFGDESPWRVEAGSMTEPTWAWIARTGCYLLFHRDDAGEAVIVGGAEGGLGDRWADPLPDAERVGRLRAWSVETLLWARRQVDTLAAGRESVPQPAFLRLPVLERRTVSSPRANAAVGGRARPFAFCLESQAATLMGGHFANSPKPPVAPFNRDLSSWRTWPWIDKSDGRPVLVRAAHDPIDQEYEPPANLVTLGALAKVAGRLVGFITPGRRRGVVERPGVTEARGVVVVGKESAGLDDEDFGPDGAGVSLRQTTYNRLCDWCGETIGPGRRDRQWCQKRCEKAGNRARARQEEKVRTCALPGCDRGPDGGPAPARPNSETCCDSHYRKVWRARRQKGKPATVSVACTSCGAVIGEGNRCATCRPKKRKAS